jgi:hypothetical protein
MNRRSIFCLKAALPMSQTIVQRDVLHHWHGANSMQYFLCLMCDFAAMFGLVFYDTNASVIIGSLKPLKCKIWNELFELNLLRFH